jgi:hypothetical protein
LLVANESSRAEPLEALGLLGFESTEADDAYAAMAELCRRPLAYRAMILSLGSLYREELTLIATVKRRFPHVEVWLTHTDGRGGALAEAMRLGADGLLAEDGLHRIALPPTSPAVTEATTAEPLASPAAGVSSAVSALGAQPQQPEGAGTASESAAASDESSPARRDHDLEHEREQERDHEREHDDLAEPVLTADELRALLQEQAPMPPMGGEE